jgi:hypothetical protein
MKSLPWSVQKKVLKRFPSNELWLIAYDNYSRWNTKTKKLAALILSRRVTGKYEVMV